MKPDHPQAAANRRAKAGRWIRILDAARSGGDGLRDDAQFAADISRITPEGWRAIATAARVPELSPPNSSLALIIEEYRSRASRRAPRTDLDWVDELTEPAE